MRRTISGLLTVAGLAVAGLFVAGSAPAMACGYTSCGAPCGYATPCGPSYTYEPAPAVVAPPPVYSGCGACGVATYQRLAEPSTQYYTEPRSTQYYYVNQGPTYSGPGSFAPYPAYQESGVVGWHRHHHHHHHAYYGGYGYHVAPGLEAPAPYGYQQQGYYHARPQAYRWGSQQYYQGRRVLRRYY